MYTSYLSGELLRKGIDFANNATHYACPYAIGSRRTPQWHIALCINRWQTSRMLMQCLKTKAEPW